MNVPTSGPMLTTFSTAPRTRLASLTRLCDEVDSSTSPRTRSSTTSGWRMAKACTAMPPIE